MKKWRHGKRHMYARRSVAIGRFNKRMRKIDRTIYILRRIDWDIFIDQFMKAWEQTVAPIIEFMNKFYKEMQRKNHEPNTSQ